VPISIFRSAGKPAAYDVLRLAALEAGPAGSAMVQYAACCTHLATPLTLPTDWFVRWSPVA